MAKDDTTYRAPVLSIDLDADGYTIWPCIDCLPWHAEVVLDENTSSIIVREWHAIGCPTLNELLAVL